MVARYFCCGMVRAYILVLGLGIVKLCTSTALHVNLLVKCQWILSIRETICFKINFVVNSF